MTLKILPKTELPNWIEKLSQEFRIFGPVPIQNEFGFKEVKSFAEMALGYNTTILPPKKAISPQREELLKFNNTENQAQAVLNNTPSVLFGVHTCDLHGINFLDTVFQRDYPDQHYLSRRKNTVIVSLECLEPCTEYSFCKDMGTYTTPANFDLHMVDVGEAYALRVGSQAGEQLLEGIQQSLISGEKGEKQLSRVMRNKWPRFTYRLQADISELPALMGASYKSPIWEDLGKRCLGCGACTLVCPTCYCFDMTDDANFAGDSGTRCRQWDSCQLNQFASVAGGHDFRPGQANRQRHRFFRKYKYQTFQPGLLGCVGCGRCSYACLVDITMIATINKLFSRRVAARHTRQEAVAI